MKKLFFLFGLIFVLSLQFCTPPMEPVDLDKEVSAIKNVLEKYVIANENEDFSIIEEIWMPAEDIILIGTDSDETLIGWEQIRKAIQGQYGNFENTLITVSDQWIKVNMTGNTAWFSEVLSYNFIYNEEAMSFEGMRFTGVLCKKEKKWKLVQGHLSIPAEVDLEEE